MAIVSVADRFTLKKDPNVLYSDFLANLNPHPDNKQLVLNKNEDAIVRSIRNLLLTDKFERPFQPTIGSKLKSFLFENISPQVTKALENDIRQTIEDHEPRARLLNIVISPIEEKNLYVVTITFYTINVEAPTTFNIVLERVR
jgi:phage baseplate assembly protein W